MLEQKDVIVLRYHNIVLRQSDLDTLIPGQWVNDTMLAFHMKFLEKTFVPKDVNYLFLKPSIVHLITFAHGSVIDLLPALPPNFESYAAIFIPVNNGKPNVPCSGTHWSLLVYIRASNSFYYYDTLKFNNLREGEYTSRRFQPLLKLRRPAKFVPNNAPQQMNGSDCGVHLISIINYILHQLLKTRGKTEPIHYDKIMELHKNDLSTPAQVRGNINGMVKRLQQRLRCTPALRVSI